jgi:hypothetical protein
MKSIGTSLFLVIGGVFVFFCIPSLSGLLKVIAFIWASGAIIFVGVQLYYWWQHKKSGYM